MKSQPIPPIVVMGVQGSGKSTIGARLAHRLGVAFVDGDSLHPAANDELDQIFDAYFADTDLWVAILTAPETRRSALGTIWCTRHRADRCGFRRTASAV